MSHHPTSLLALARSYNDDLLREAERHRLASAARRDEDARRVRLGALLRRRGVRRGETARVAPAAK
jgi:hypothetical protein